MMEDSSADVIQIYRYSDFTLLKTIALTPGSANGRVIEGSQRAGFGPRILGDGSVFFNSYGCAFYRLSDIAAENPKLETRVRARNTGTEARRHPRLMRHSDRVRPLSG